MVPFDAFCVSVGSVVFFAFCVAVESVVSHMHHRLCLKCVLFWWWSLRIVCGT